MATSIMHRDLLQRLASHDSNLSSGTPLQYSLPHLSRPQPVDGLRDAPDASDHQIQPLPSAPPVSSPVCHSEDTSQQYSEPLRTSKGTSNFTGVSWNSHCQRWRAQVWENEIVHHLGYFDNEQQAAKTYDLALIKLKGRAAKTNFPAEQYSSSDVASYRIPPKKRKGDKVRKAVAASTRVDRAGMQAPLLTRQARLAQEQMDYKGVKYDPVSCKYQAIMCCNDSGKVEVIGWYEEAKDAAMAYDVRMYDLMGDKAEELLNHAMDEVSAAAVLFDLQGAVMGSLEQDSPAEDVDDPVPQRSACAPEAFTSPNGTNTRNPLARTHTLLADTATSPQPKGPYPGPSRGPKDAAQMCKRGHLDLCTPEVSGPQKKAALGRAFAAPADSAGPTRQDTKQDGAADCHGDAYDAPEKGRDPQHLQSPAPGPYRRWTPDGFAGSGDEDGAREDAKMVSKYIHDAMKQVHPDGPHGVSFPGPAATAHAPGQAYHTSTAPPDRLPSLGMPPKGPTGLPPQRRHLLQHANSTTMPFMQGQSASYPFAPPPVGWADQDPPRMRADGFATVTTSLPAARTSTRPSGSPSNSEPSGEPGASAQGPATRRVGSSRKRTSRFYGVSWIENERKWVARAWDPVQQKQKTLGRFAENEEDKAAMLVDRAKLEHQRGNVPLEQLNFPSLHSAYCRVLSEPAVRVTGDRRRSVPDAGAAVAAPAARAAVKGPKRARSPNATSSEYKGVSWIENSKKWRAQIWTGGAVQFIGYYHSEEEAARAFDKAVLLLGEGKETNFPPEEYDVLDDDPNVAKLKPKSPGSRRGGSYGSQARDGPPSKRRRSHNNGKSSQFRGVSWSERSKKWRAQLWHDRKVLSLGFFEDEEEAARHYEQQRARVKGAHPTAVPFILQDIQMQVQEREGEDARAGAAAAELEGEGLPLTAAQTNQRYPMRARRSRQPVRVSDEEDSEEEDYCDDEQEDEEEEEIMYRRRNSQSLTRGTRSRAQAGITNSHRASYTGPSADDVEGQVCQRPEGPAADAAHIHPDRRRYLLSLTNSDQQQLHGNPTGPLRTYTTPSPLPFSWGSKRARCAGAPFSRSNSQPESAYTAHQAEPMLPAQEAPLPPVFMPASDSRPLVLPPLHLAMSKLPTSMSSLPTSLSIGSHALLHSHATAWAALHDPAASRVQPEDSQAQPVGSGHQPMVSSIPATAPNMQDGAALVVLPTTLAPEVSLPMLLSQPTAQVASQSSVVHRTFAAPLLSLMEQADNMPGLWASSGQGPPGLSLDTVQGGSGPSKSQDAALAKPQADAS